MSARPTGRVILDARPALSRGTGVGEYVLGLAQGLAEVADEEDEELVLFTASWKDRPQGRLLQCAAAPRTSLCHRRIPVRLLNACWHRLRWPPVELLAGEAGIAHSPHPLILPSSRARRVVTVHDLYFLRSPEHTFAEVRRDYGPRLWSSLEAADAVLCVSEATRKDLLAHADGHRPLLASALEEKITVVPNGVDADFFAAPESGGATRAHGERAGAFYLAVGRVEERKNPERLLRAFASVDGDASLVWAGMPADETWGDRFRGWVAELGLEDRVELLGWVDRERLRDLYRNARGLLFPSLHEGFGLPILEAMASGCPVLTSSTSAMPEVAGDAALLVDPLSLESVAAGIRALEDQARRNALVDAGAARVRRFSWTDTARRTRSVYRSLMGDAG